MIAPSRRLIASCLLLMAASLLISLLGLAQGPVPLTIDQVFSALFGDAPRNVAMVVNEWRLPRVLMALLIGAALGVSGAAFSGVMPPITTHGKAISRLACSTISSGVVTGYFFTSEG